MRTALYVEYATDLKGSDGAGVGTEGIPAQLMAGGER